MARPGKRSKHRAAALSPGPHSGAGESGSRVQREEPGSPSPVLPSTAPLDQGLPLACAWFFVQAKPLGVY